MFGVRDPPYLYQPPVSNLAPFTGHRYHRVNAPVKRNLETFTKGGYDGMTDKGRKEGTRSTTRCLTIKLQKFQINVFLL